MWWVYCLATVESPIQTYVGATVDLDRRLRQHNKEIKGGARRTGVRPGGWYRICAVTGFSSWHEALQFEWRWKWFSRSPAVKRAGGPLERRSAALEKCLVWWMETHGVELEVVEEGEEKQIDTAEENATTDIENMT